MGPAASACTAGLRRSDIMDWKRLGLTESPFSIGCDPRFFFGAAAHQEACARLIYLATSGQPVLALVGDPGTGKTIVINHWKDRLDPAKFRVVSVQNPLLEGTELLQEILFGATGSPDIPASKREVLNRLRDCFTDGLDAGRRCVIAIDEAHLIPHQHLEEIRMLVNYEHRHQPAVSLVLSGQAGLLHSLDAVPSLKQKVSLIARLSPLTAAEVSAYVRHRIDIAGYVGTDPMFIPETFPKIFRRTGGIPRLINQVCGLALLAASEMDAPLIDATMLDEGLNEPVREPATAVASSTAD